MTVFKSIMRGAKQALAYARGEAAEAECQKGRVACCFVESDHQSTCMARRQEFDADGNLIGVHDPNIHGWFVTCTTCGKKWRAEQRPGEPVEFRACEPR